MLNALSGGGSEVPARGGRRERRDEPPGRPAQPLSLFDYVAGKIDPALEQALLDSGEGIGKGFTLQYVPLSF